MKMNDIFKIKTLSEKRNVVLPVSPSLQYLTHRTLLTPFGSVFCLLSRSVSRGLWKSMVSTLQREEKWKMANHIF